MAKTGKKPRQIAIANNRKGVEPAKGRPPKRARKVRAPAAGGVSSGASSEKLPANKVETGRKLVLLGRKNSDSLSWWINQYLSLEVTTVESSRREQRRDLAAFLSFMQREVRHDHPGTRGRRGSRKHSRWRSRKRSTVTAAGIGAIAASTGCSRT